MLISKSPDQASIRKSIPLFKKISVTPLLVLLVFIVQGCSQQDSVNVAYVANAANNNVEMINLDTGESVYKLYTGATPWRLVKSPKGHQLWIQHWYSETTAVVGLADHEVKTVLPFRGPGTFTQDASQFVTYSWPKSDLYVVNAADLEVKDQRPTEISRVYDMVARQDGKGLYMTRFDPIAKGRKERYEYMLFYPYNNQKHIKTPPASLKTGLSPTRIAKSAKDPFLLTTDNDTDGLSIINLLGDVRSFKTCPTPIDIALSKDEKRMVVICWEGQGARDSEVIVYDANLSNRPWPEITLVKRTNLSAGLVRVQFDESSNEILAIDQTNNRMIKLDAKTLSITKSYQTGDMPTDMVVYNMPKAQYEQLAKGETKSRQLLKSVISKMQTARASFNDLTWKEVSELRLKSESAMVKTSNSDSNKKPNQEHGHDHSDEAGHSHAQDNAKKADAGELVESITMQQFLHKVDGVRTETSNGVIKISNAGTSVSIMENGRYWMAPEQSLAPAIWRLPNLTMIDAIKHLAGDVPHSSYMRTGLAVDVITEITEGHHSYFLIGSHKGGVLVAQLWVDADSGLPTNLIDKFPVVKSTSEHAAASFSGLVETKFYDFGKAGDKYLLPSYMERTIDKKFKEKIKLTEFKKDSGIDLGKFSIQKLGNNKVTPKFVNSPVQWNKQQEQQKESAKKDPFAAEYISHPFEDRQPYVNNPPILGKHLPYIADWGVHDQPIPLELQLHNLKDGGVAIQYNCSDGCPELVSELTEIVKAYPKFVLLAPYPLMQDKIAITAWGKAQTMEKVEKNTIKQFIEKNIGINHHGKNAGEYL